MYTLFLALVMCETSEVRRKTLPTPSLQSPVRFSQLAEQRIDDKQILDRRLANTSGAAGREEGGGAGEGGEGGRAPGRISRGFEPKTFSLDK